MSLPEIDMGEGNAGFVLGSGPVGVLLVHGLTGTPMELRQIAKGLAKRGCTVYVPTLIGHCGTDDDLKATKWHQWYESARKTYLGVRARHEKVFVGGLSMGAVLSMHMAAEFPEIAGLMLYSTTLRYDGWNIPKAIVLLPFVMPIPFIGVHLCGFKESFPYGIKDDRLRAVVERQMKAGESSEAGLLTMSGLVVRELRRMIAVVKTEMPSIKTPALVMHSDNDDIASSKNADYVEQHLGGPVTKVLLDDCYHMITVDKQYKTVVSMTADFIEALAPEAKVSPEAQAPQADQMPDEQRKMA